MVSYYVYPEEGSVALLHKAHRRGHLQVAMNRGELRPLATPTLPFPHGRISGGISGGISGAPRGREGLLRGGTGEGDARGLG